MASSEQACLLSFDTDRVKDYIFATADLKKVRGASTLLESLNQEETPEVIKSCCHAAGYDIPGERIVTGGGTAMAVVPTKELAQRVKEAVQRLYQKRTATCSITGTWVEVHEADLKTEFGNHVSHLSAQLRSAKDSKGHEMAFPLTSYTRPCDACGRHPGSRPYPYEQGRVLCLSCWNKHERNESGTNRFRRQLQDVARETHRYSHWLDIWSPEDPHQGFPKDLGDIGRTSHPPNYVGFILADGNGIGSLLGKMKGYRAYRDFASGLDKLMRQVTCNALLSVPGGPPGRIAPFEILLMGGDDLMIVVAADAALKVALRIVEDFEKGANELAHSPEVGLPQEEHLSLSAGVVIAHDHFPIKAMHDLASDLLQRAKLKTSQVEAALKGQAPGPGKPDSEHRGAVDFMVVSEASTAGLDFVRSHVLTEASFEVPPAGEDRFVLTERPYTARELQRLLDFVREFKQSDFPSRSLHALYEALFHSKVQAQLTALTVLTRAKDEHQELLKRFFEESRIGLDSLPWRKVRPQQYSTPLGDLTEVYPFAYH